MLNVFLTIDTEVWPLLPDWRRNGLGRDIERDIYGVTSRGAFGISYQIDVLNRYGLTGVFLVEPLFAEVAGLDKLTAVVSEIQGNGHEVQAHLHPEWLQWMEQSPFPGKSPSYLRQFSEEDQAKLLARGLALLRQCGARSLCAFRAGDYAANFDTLRALARNGLRFDTSYNPCYLGTRCGLETPEPLLQPTQMGGVHEFPISFFRDGLGRLRHAPLASCSWPELRSALLQARQQEWHAFVIVSHSFELLKPRRKNPAHPLPDRTVIRRFDRLCRFLAENRADFRTASFSAIDPDVVPVSATPNPLRCRRQDTFGRLAEQIGRRVF